MEGLRELYEIVCDRKRNPSEGSYTAYLFEKGLDKILKKCGEECSEVIIAAKNPEPEPLTEEVCDLLYHLLVLLAERNVPLSAIEDVLIRRREKIGNLKPMKTVDRES